MLDVGEYDVKVQLSSRDANTFEDKNGTVLNFIEIKEGDVSSMV